MPAKYVLNVDPPKSAKYALKYVKYVSNPVRKNTFWRITELVGKFCIPLSLETL